MTHDELLKRLWEKRNAGCDNLDIHFALSAVVEFHKPIGSHDVCEGCETKFYPCPTIKAIVKELG